MVRIYGSVLAVSSKGCDMMKFMVVLGTLAREVITTSKEMIGNREDEKSIIGISSPCHRQIFEFFNKSSPIFPISAFGVA